MQRKLFTRLAGATLTAALALGLGFSNPSPAAAAFTATASSSQVVASSGQQHRGGGWRDFTGRALVGALVKATATATNQTRAAVVTAVQGGQTLAQVAVAGGSSEATVVQAVMTKLSERLTQAVTNGRITQAEADTILAEATTEAGEVMNDATLDPSLRGRSK